MEKRGGVEPNSTVSSLITAQEKSNVELEKLTVCLAKKDTEIAILKAELA